MPFVSSVRGNYGNSSKGKHVAQFIRITDRRLGTVTFQDLKTKITLSSYGEYLLDFISGNGSSPGLPPVTCNVALWGAGGRAGNIGGWTSGFSGGAGGHACGVLTIPSTSAVVLVGEPGYPSGAKNAFTYGGGHTSNPPNGGADHTSIGDRRYSGGGGGFSAIFSGGDVVHNTHNSFLVPPSSAATSNYRTATLQNRSLIVAGGGGGGGSTAAGASWRAGAGGGSTGQRGENHSTASEGTQSQVGQTQNGQWSPSYTTSRDTMNLPQRMAAGPGEGESYGGGGGGGYFAGAGSGRGEASYMPGGSGGSGYLHPTYVTSGVNSQGSFTTTPTGGNAFAIANYVSGRGAGGTDVGGASTAVWSKYNQVNPTSLQFNGAIYNADRAEAGEGLVVIQFA